MIIGIQYQSLKVLCYLAVLVSLISVLTACKSQTIQTSLVDNPVAVEEKRDVYYAGFAYLGKHKLIDENYAEARRLNKATSGPGGLEKALIAHINAIPQKNINLRFDLANRRDSNENIVVALAIENESSHSYKFKEGVTKLLVEVSAQLLFFDFGNMTLVANYPLRQAVQNTVRDSANIDQEIGAMFDAIYLGSKNYRVITNTLDEDQTLRGDYERGILYEAASVLADFNLSQHIKDIRVQMAQVKLKNGVEKVLPASIRPESYQQHIGQFFSAELSKHYRLAVLPYVRGYTIGNKMPGRFSNGDIFTLQLPEPDYTFEFSLVGFGKAFKKPWMHYHAYGNLAFSEPLMGKQYINDDFKMRVSTPVTSEDIEDWGGYNDAVEELLSSLAVQLGQPDDDWFDEHARTSSDSYSNFKNKRDLFSEVIRK